MVSSPRQGPGVAGKASNRFLPAKDSILHMLATVVEVRFAVLMIAVLWNTISAYRTKRR